MEGSHGVRLYSASTVASRSGRSSVSHKASVPHTLVPSSLSSARRSSSAARRGRPSSSLSSSRPATAVGSSSTDLTDRHAHHQHGTQSSTPVRSRGGLAVDADAPLPQFGFLSPNSQRLLHKKMQSMRLLGQFKEMFGAEGGAGEGEAARRFGSD